MPANKTDMYRMYGRPDVSLHLLHHAMPVVTVGGNRTGEVDWPAKLRGALHRPPPDRNDGH